MEFNFSKKNKLMGGGLLLFIIAIIVIAVIYKSNSIFSVTSPLADTLGEATVEEEYEEVVSQVEEKIDAAPTPQDTSKVGVLLLGYGGAGHEGGYLMDALQLMVVDFKKETITFISIPRDLWVKASSSGVKINSVILSSATNKSSVMKSGAPQLKKMVTEITGVPVHYFAGVDFVGFQRAIGINLKGIDVEVSETLEDPWYPIPGEQQNPCGHSPEEIAEFTRKYSGFELEKQFPCRYKHLLFKKGQVRMEGGDALEYVRSRHGSAEGDVSRGKRQQDVLKGIRAKLFKVDALGKLPDFFTTIVKHTATDVDLAAIQLFKNELLKSKDFQVKTINLSTSNVLTSSKSSQGAYIMMPKTGEHNWGEVKKYIQEQMEK